MQVDASEPKCFSAPLRTIPDIPDAEVDVGWFKFPNHLAHRLHKIKSSSLKVYAALRRFSQGTGTAWPSIAKIREMTGLSTSTIQRALRDLEKLKLIKRRFQRGHSTNYRVNDMLPTRAKYGHQ